MVSAAITGTCIEGASGCEISVLPPLAGGSMAQQQGSALQSFINRLTSRSLLTASEVLTRMVCAPM